MPTKRPSPDARPAPDLPPGLALAWGLTPAPTRGPRPGMTTAAIVQAAMEIADADGLGAVSMSRVAERLGYTTMSLYRYVPSKDDLVMLMFDAALAPQPPRPPDAGWREGLECWARELLTAWSRHSWLVDIPINGPPALPNHVAWLEWGLAALKPSGLPAAECLSVLLLVSGYVRNVAQLSRDLSCSGKAGTSPPDVAERYEEILGQLVAADRYPALHDALHRGLLTDGSDEDVVEFEFGLQRILDGVEVLVAARNPKAAKRASRAAGRANRR